MNPESPTVTVLTPFLAADAPSKINLTLDVLARREDGFHEIRSLVVGVDRRDRVRCRLTDRPGVAMRCSDPTLATEDNLCCRAAKLLASRIGVDPCVEIEVQKRIPIGGGLGGGSSDAAVVLGLCNRLWNAGLAESELAVIGAEVGSDVPLFFHLPAAVVRGRGEVVEPVVMAWAGCALLISPPVSVSTPAVYNAWRVGDAEVRSTGDELAIRRCRSAGELMPRLSNHLEPAVFRVAREVKRVYDTIEEAGLGPIRVSGAGATMYRLFDNESVARLAAGAVQRLGLGITTYIAAVPVGLGRTDSEES